MICIFSTKNFKMIKRFEKKFCSIKIALSSKRLRSKNSWSTEEWPICYVEYVEKIAHENTVGIRITLWDKDTEKWEHKTSLLSPEGSQLPKCIFMNPLSDEDIIIYGLFL
jgi:hypothetical protein